ncbi:arylamine N-acetyltransferase [Streptomyces sp. NPDC050560]|uniref:arylamine N-acetyltransferase n=1 Tax=Streptomyces sp. NPDC050560 TaxID=3365630 RepID=UPI00379ED1C1
MDTTHTDAYLRRIGVPRPEGPTPQALRELHLAHQRTVPFENLSLHLGEPLTLTGDALVAKVVDRHRGGFCYELNGAFLALLGALGYRATPLQARVYGRDGGLGIPYDHMALRVDTGDGRALLADVGFGDLSDHPLALDTPGREQHDPAGTFTVAPAGDGTDDLDVYAGERPRYRLEQRPRRLRDFTAAAWYHRTCPDSGFTRSLVCSLRTPDGRITLGGRTLKRTTADTSVSEELADDTAVLAAYRDHFGIELDRVPEVAEAFRT